MRFHPGLFDFTSGGVSAASRSSAARSSLSAAKESAGQDATPPKFHRACPNSGDRVRPEILENSPDR